MEPNEILEVYYPEVAQAVREERVRLIAVGQKDIRDLVDSSKRTTAQDLKELKAKVNAKKGGYSRKLRQFLKREYVLEFVRLNELTASYSSYNNVCEAFFDEAFDHTLVAGLKKSKKWGARQPPVQEVFDEEIFEQVKEYLSTLLSIERAELLRALTYSFVDYGFPVTKMLIEEVRAPKRIQKL